MTVKELIGKLEKFSPDMEVLWNNISLIENSECPIESVYFSVSSEDEKLIALLSSNVY